MEISIAPGRYVVAVSGGVDSMALLHVLKDVAGVELIVAHFDHGIRTDSELDRRLVEAEAVKYGLIFKFAEGKLGPGTSEARARKARYDYLMSVKEKHEALALITAHHQDDVLETAILNLSRGTGWRGLVSLAETPLIKRPLLNTSKMEILEYAEKHDLVWREDATNSDETYLRNYIRHTVMPQFGIHDRAKLIKIINNTRGIGADINKLTKLIIEVNVQENKLDRTAVRDLSDDIIQELLITWWRQNGFYSYESKTLKRAVENIKMNKSGAIVPLKGTLEMLVGRTKLALIQRER